MNKTITMILIVGVLFIGAEAGIEKIEKAECKKWAEQAEEYPEFYYTDWQANQCKNR